MSLTMEDPMDDRRFVTKLINPLGTTRWQPTLPDGQRALKKHLRFFPWSNVWAPRGHIDERINDGPRLYRSRARAARVAKRQWVRVAGSQWEDHPMQTA